MSEEGVYLPGWHGGDGSAAYLDKRLTHHRMELAFDEGVSPSMILQLWGAGLMAAAIVWFVSLFFVLFSLSVAGTAAFALLPLGGLAGGVAFWLVVLFVRLPEPIAEWNVLLPDGGARAPSVYSQIAAVVRARALPLRPTFRRIRTGMGPEHVTHRLVLNSGDYHAYVSVFRYGTSLYLGWMMWRSRRGHALIGQFVGGIVNSLLGRNSPEAQLMRTEPVRAMREAVHLVAREGLTVAIEGREVPEYVGFPQGMPPIDQDVHRASVPGWPSPNTLPRPSNPLGAPIGDPYQAAGPAPDAGDPPLAPWTPTP